MGIQDLIATPRAPANDTQAHATHTISPRPPIAIGITSPSKMPASSSFTAPNARTAESTIHTIRTIICASLRSSVLVNTQPFQWLDTVFEALFLRWSAPAAERQVHRRGA